MRKKIITFIGIGLICLANSCLANDMYKCQDSELIRSYKVALNNKSYNDADDMLKALRQRHKGLENNYEYAQIFNCYASKGLKEARVAAQKVTNMFPNRYEGYFWQGYIALQEKDFHNAIHNLNLAKRLKQNDLDILTNLVYSYYWAGRDLDCYAEAKIVAKVYENNSAKKMEMEDISRTYMLGAISAFSVGNNNGGFDMLERMVEYTGKIEGDECHRNLLDNAKFLLSKKKMAKNSSTEVRQYLDSIEIPYYFDNDFTGAISQDSARYGYEKPDVQDPSIEGSVNGYVVDMNSMPTSSTIIQTLPSVVGAVAAYQIVRHVHNHGHRGHHRR